MRTTSILAIMAVLFVSMTSASEKTSYAQLYQSVTGNIVQFVSGLTKGLVGEDLGQDFGQCLGEGETIAAEVEEAIHNIEAGDFSNIVNGIFRLI